MTEFADDFYAKKTTKTQQKKPQKHFCGDVKIFYEVILLRAVPF